MNDQEIVIKVVPESDLTAEENIEIQELLQKIFGHIPREEIEDDFYAPKFAVIVAKLQDELVGYTGLYKREVEYEGKKIKIGGVGGLLTREDMRRQGIATKISLKALEVLKNEHIDVAFHSIETTSTTAKFYEKLGYTLMKQPFRWKSKKGELKSGMGGMIAPLNSERLFSLILNGKTPFYVGEGYWS